MRFPAKFAPAKEGGFVVTFPDIPEAITQGDDDAEAMRARCEMLLRLLLISISKRADAFLYPRGPNAGNA